MNKLIFLDTETTGNDLEKDKLIQLSYKNNGEVHTELFKPNIPITFEAMAVHHITSKMDEDKLHFYESKMHYELEKLLEDGGIVVAHNAQFDIAMLKHDELDPKQFICTLKVARHVDDKCEMSNYKMQYLRYYLDLDVNGKAHDAEGDVMVLEALYNHYAQKLSVEEMLDISGKPSLIRKFNFGKYNGQMIGDVDKGYLEWLLDQKLEQNKPEDEDWIYTLKHYLDLL